MRGLDAKYFNDPRTVRAHRRQGVLPQLVARLPRQPGQYSPGDFLTLSKLYDQDILITHTRDGEIKAFTTSASTADTNSPRAAATASCWSAPITPGLTISAGNSRQRRIRNKVPGFDSPEGNLPDPDTGREFPRLSLYQPRPGLPRAWTRSTRASATEMLKLCPDVEQRRYAYHHTADEGCNWFDRGRELQRVLPLQGTATRRFAKGIIDPGELRDRALRRYPGAAPQLASHRTATRPGTTPAAPTTAAFSCGRPRRSSFTLAAWSTVLPGARWRSTTYACSAAFTRTSGEVDETLQKVIDNDRVTTFQEDLDIVKQVQRGINSRGYRPGPLISNPEGGINNERYPIQKLHEWLRAAVD